MAIKWIVEDIAGSRYMALHGWTSVKTGSMRFDTKEGAEEYLRKSYPAVRANVVQDNFENELVSYETYKAETEYNPYGPNVKQEPIRHTVVYGD